MALLLTLLAAVATCIVIRALGLRASLTERCLLTFGALGVLIAIVVLPLVPRLIAPYDQTSLRFAGLIHFGILGVLGFPILRPLLTGRNLPSLGLVDLFLLGFALGFGADAIGVVLAAAAKDSTFRHLTLLPPWTTRVDTHFAAGYAYRVALTVAIPAFVLRRTGRRRPAMIALGVALLLLSLEYVGLRAIFDGSIASAPKLLRWLAGALLNGRLLPWAAVAILVGASLWEVRWTTRLDQAGARRFQGLEEARDLLGLLLKRAWSEYRRRFASIATQRQARIVDAQLARRPGDPTLTTLSKELQRRVQGVAFDDPAVSAISEPRTTSGRPLAVLIGRVATILALLLVVFVAPRLASDKLTSIWSVPVLGWKFVTFPITVLQTALAAVLVWRYVTFSGDPAPDEPDAVLMDFRAERAILRVGAFAVALALLGPADRPLYPFPNELVSFAKLQLPTLSPTAWVGFVLVLCVALSEFSVRRAVVWRSAPLDERRRSAVRNATLLAGVFLLLWIARSLYPATVQLLHHVLGRTLQKWFATAAHAAESAQTGQKVALVLALTAIIVWISLAGLAVRPLRVAADRLEEFLTRPAPVIEPELAAEP
jgi:hypothetical protein